MLRVHDKVDNWIVEIIKDDPVRPELSADFRINENSEIFSLWDDSGLGAICCVRYTEGIPASIEQLQEKSNPFADTVVFYTIWSYKKGCGRNLIIEASEHIANRNPEIKNFVTLSPKTPMAEKFHISNGAWKYRVNPETVNYAYKLQE